MAADNKYFVDVFADIVSAVRAAYDPTNLLAPYYMYGHPREIANRLDLKNQKAIEKYRKFPMVVLITDLTEKAGEDHNFLYELKPFSVVIVTSTNPTYISSERDTNSFKPILQPIYELLINKILVSKTIATPNKLVKHEKINRYAWGSSSLYGNTGIVFNDFLDAIEITFEEIKVFKPSLICTSL